VYSIGIAYLLWLVSGFGALGLHRFYLGKILTGILWMCTGGLAGIGALYDLFTLPWQVREANSARAAGQSQTAWQPPPPSGADYNAENNGGGQTWRYVNDGDTTVGPPDANNTEEK
jgi:TM2 domain-containing membrane protein YozV